MRLCGPDLPAMRDDPTLDDTSYPGTEKIVEALRTLTAY